MKIGPTIDKRIKLQLDHDGDIYLLTQLVSDAVNDDDTDSLVNQVGCKMDDEDWEEFVKPDLISHFRDEIVKVSEVIQSAIEEKEKEIFISKDISREWYSTLNQARLHLEKKYTLSEVEDGFQLEDLDDELVDPAIKNNFYTHLQGLILEYIDL